MIGQTKDEIITDRFFAGESVSELADDYTMPVQEVEDILRKGIPETIPELIEELKARQPLLDDDAFKQGRYAGLQEAIDLILQWF